jgi:hypothetical protein
MAEGRRALRWSAPSVGAPPLLAGEGGAERRVGGAACTKPLPALNNSAQGAPLTRPSGTFVAFRRSTGAPDRCAIDSKSLTRERAPTANVLSEDLMLSFLIVSLSNDEAGGPGSRNGITVPCALALRQAQGEVGISLQTYPRPQNLAYIPPHLTARKAGSRRTVRRGEIGRKGSRLLSGRYRSAWRPKRAPLPRALHLVGAIPPCEDSWAVRCVGCTMIAAPKILVGRRGASLIHICGLPASGQSPRRPAFHCSNPEAIG